ncbi:hypothetical protein T459_22228 [Capsicum annuum]|uniref:WW domain-containing protein n=1 Tax=Capsicum annuum TaxID=4072 RepID=A0A2G2YZ82_CAPAN|nr:hypothetical protein T459_22228 [Capsicum annuum]
MDIGPAIPPLAGPAPGAIPSMLLQFQPMLLAQQAQPYGFGPSQQFMPLGNANVVMYQPSQIQFPQPMQQVTGRPVVGMHSMPQGPPIPHDFQRNLPMLNNHMPGSSGPNLPLSSSYNQVNADFSGSQYQTQINDQRFPSGVQPWIPISNHNVNSATTMQKTEELAAPLVVLRADASTDWREFTSPKRRKMLIALFVFCTYYYNKVTRTSKWRMPDEVKLAHEKDTISHASDFRSISVVKTSSPGADGSLVSENGAKSSPIVVSPATNLPTIMASVSSSLSDKNVKKDAAITEIGGATPSDEKTVELGPLVYESKAAMRAVINDRRYGALKSLCERKQAFNEAISIFEHDECFKAVEQAKDREDLFEDYVEELEKKVKLLLQNFLEHTKALEEQKRNRVEYLEFLKSCDFIKEYIRDLESEEEEQRKLRMIKDFAAYLVVSSNTSGSTAKYLQMLWMSWRNSCNGGMVVSTDTVVSVVDGGGRGGDAGDSGGDGVRRICGS